MANYLNRLSSVFAFIYFFLKLVLTSFLASFLFCTSFSSSFPSSYTSLPLSSPSSSFILFSLCHFHEMIRRFPNLPLQRLPRGLAEGPGPEPPRRRPPAGRPQEVQPRLLRGGAGGRLRLAQESPGAARVAATPAAGPATPAGQRTPRLQLTVDVGPRELPGMRGRASTRVFLFPAALHARGRA